MTSFNLNHFFKDSVFKDIHILGLRTSTCEFWEDTVQPITLLQGVIDRHFTRCYLEGAITGQVL